MPQAEINTTFGKDSSFTAQRVAKHRGEHTDIPYAKQISTILEELFGPVPDNPNIPVSFHAYLELRYKYLDLLLKESKATKVFEIASGLAPRGLIHSGTKGIQYVEMDLPEEMRLKEQIIRTLCKKQGISFPEKLWLQGGDGSHPEDFKRACDYFKGDGLLAILFEGHWRYLSFDDKHEELESARLELTKHGGRLITPDIELLEGMTLARSQAYEKFRQTSGKDVRPNLFKTLEHAISFCKDRGFKVKYYSTADTARDMYDSLVSPKHFNLNKEDLATSLSHRYTFVLEVA